MPRNIPLDPELAGLVREYEEAREARRAASEALKAADNAPTFAALCSALAAEERAAVRVAHVLALRTKEAA